MINLKIQKFLFRVKKKAVLINYKLQGKQFIHFLHIGKTGGSAIKHSISNNLQSANSLKNAFKLNEYIIFFHPHRIKIRNVPKGGKIVFFLRDPVGRFVSGFYARKRKDQPRYNFDWTPAEKVAFSHFNTPNQLAITLSSDDESERTIAQNALNGIEHVNQPYSFWIESETYLMSRRSDILFIGFQENLTQDFKILKSKLNLPDNVKLPEDDLHSHRSLKGEVKTLEDRAVENIRDWYSDDYKILSLCKEIMKL